MPRYGVKITSILSRCMCMQACDAGISMGMISCTFFKKVFRQVFLSGTYDPVRAFSIVLTGKQDHIHDAPCWKGNMRHLVVVVHLATATLLCPS